MTGSSSTTKDAADSNVGETNVEGAQTGYKRKHSAQAFEMERKKSKTSAVESGADSGSEENAQEDVTQDSEEPTEEILPELPRPGPHVLYLWSDAVDTLINNAELDAAPYVTLKYAALAAYRRFAAVPEDDLDQFGVLARQADDVPTWMIAATDEARATPAAQALLQEWHDLVEVERETKLTAADGEDEAGDGKARDEGEDDKDEDDEDEDGSDQWWYELTLQKERPEGSLPSVEVTLSNGGEEPSAWFLTHIGPAYKEGTAAMRALTDHLMMRYY